MKKLMTSTIILLPLLLLAIMLVSGAIMSLVTHIYVEQVEFVGNGALVLVMEDEAEPPTEKLEVNILPLKAENRGLSYSVVDEDIATVDQNGNITARDYGETYVTVTSKENKAAVARRKVLVTDSHVHRISINDGYSRELYENATEELHVSVIPKEAENKSVKWESSNPDILFVSANGTVTAKGEGTATITATSYDNPSAVATTEVITCHRQIQSMYADATLVETSLNTAKFPKVTYEPAEAFVNLTYKSSDTDVATVDGQGNITFHEQGAVTITAVATDFGGNAISVPKPYIFTDGYYMLPLFSGEGLVNRNLTVDFDEYFKNGEATKPLPISFGQKPDPDAHLLFQSVEFSINGESVSNVLEFDETAGEFRFIGEMPKGGTENQTVRVTVHVKAYDRTVGDEIETYDYFNLVVNRDATSLAVEYGGTDAQAIQISNATIRFGMSETSTSSSNEAYAYVKAGPANHTNTYSYALSEADRAVATLTALNNSGRLEFKDKTKEAAVTVTVSLKAGERVVLTKDVRVSYVPTPPASSGKEQVPVPTWTPDSGEPKPTPKVTLKPPASQIAGEPQDMGTLNFTEPANTTVEYEVKGQTAETPVSEAVVTVEKDEVSGVPHIVAHRGGFATIVITVTPGEAAPVLRTAGPREGNADGSYTIEVEVYVDYEVKAEDFTVTFGNEVHSYTTSNGTQLAAKPGEIPFTVTVKNDDGRMEGKQLFVTYGGTTLYDEDAAENSATFTGTINLLDGTLPVKFGLQYIDKAEDLGGSRNLARVSVTKTLYCNAESIEVAYDGVNTTKIVTSSAALSFEGSNANATVTVSPAGHTDTLSYVLKNGEESIATLSGGSLSFKDRNAAATAHVLVQLKRGGEVTLEKEITVIYVPTNGNNVAVKGENNEKVLLTMNGEKVTGTLYLTEPEGQKITCTTPSDGAVSVAQLGEGGAWQITAVKGGFADVTVTIGTESHTVKVYVDQPVSVNDFTVKFGDITPDTVFGTTGTDVAYEFTVANPKGNMQGKQLTVTYTGTNENPLGTENASTHSGKIDFPKESTRLVVTFGVQYTDEAKEFVGDATISATKQITIVRDAESVEVLYMGNTSSAITTKQTNLTLTTLDIDDISHIYVKVDPDTYDAETNVITYSFEGNHENATLDENGHVLKFTDANQNASVTIQVTVKHGEHEVSNKFTVNYVAPTDGVKDIQFTESVTSQKIVLEIHGNNTKDEGRILLNLSTGETATYNITKGRATDGDVVEFKEDAGVHYIVPKKGGFATVEVQVNKDGGESTTYTIEVYVDHALDDGKFEIDLNGANTKGTAANQFTFTVTIQDAEATGSMEGKILTATYGSQTKEGKKGETSFTDTFDYSNATGDDKTVKFGIKYDADTKEYAESIKDNNLPSTTREILWNANGLEAKYNDQAVQRIVIDDKTFTFGAKGDVAVSVLPTYHTDTLTYELKKGAAATAQEPNGLYTLTFNKAGEATVTISVKRDGELTDQNLTKTITIVYAPEGKRVDVNETEIYLTLKKNSETADMGTLFFTEAENSKVDYVATLGKDTVIEFTNKISEGVNGAYQIKAVKGGFATVTISENNKVTHTIHIYVDEAVTKDDFTVTLTGANGKQYSDGYGTTGTEVTFEVTMKNSNAMQGKVLYVNYGDGEHELHAVEGKSNVYTSDTGKIPFANLEKLEVTFGVKYSDKANAYGPEGGLSTTTRTILCDAESATATYGGVNVYEGGKQGKIVTNNATLTLGEGEADVQFNVIPVKHSDKLFYQIEGDAQGASIPGDLDNGYKLVFDGAANVTLKIYRTRDGGTNKTELATVVVVYAPTGYDSKAIEVGQSDEELNEVLGYGSRTPSVGILYFTEAAGKNYSYAITAGGEAGSEVISLAETNGAWKITALKGGFATVTITAEGETHTVNIYVDQPVSSSDFEVEFKSNNGNTVLTPTADGDTIFRTSYEGDKVKFKVTVNNVDGMAGKRLYVKIDDIVYMHGETGENVLEGTFKDNEKDWLAGDTAHVITFGVEYDDAAKLIVGDDGNGLAYVTRSLQSTHGMLYSGFTPTVKYYLGEVGKWPSEPDVLNKDGATEIVFNGLGSKLAIGIPTSDRNSNLMDPVDIRYLWTTAVNNSCKLSEDAEGTDTDIAEIKQQKFAFADPNMQLESKSYCTDKTLYFTIVGKTFELKVSVIIPAQTMKVEGGGTSSDLRVLDETTNYKTLLDELTFKVTLGREDDLSFDNKNVQWSFNSTDWNVVESSSIPTTFAVNLLKDGYGNALSDSIYFRSGDKAVSMRIQLNKVDTPDFNFNLFVKSTAQTENEKESKNYFASIESALIGTNREFSYPLPVDMDGTIAFEIELIGDYLGGVGTNEEFESNVIKQVLKADPDINDWNPPETSNGQIIFSTQDSSEFTMQCKAGFYGKSVTVTFTHVVRDYAFPGFDSSNPSDIYKGYQQVRVFAKHSDYAEGGTSNVVDYFKLPVQAFKGGQLVKNDTSIQNFNWKFTGYKGDTPTSFTLSQTGKYVTYNGANYIVVQESGTSGKQYWTLKPAQVTGDIWTAQEGSAAIVDENGKYVAGQTKVPWVDCYSEKGYAHIYFGDFKGLSETDIQNDYFGDFGDEYDGKTDETTWKQPEANVDDQSGRIFTPSTNAYTFLRVSAHVGENFSTEIGHFNFNVLDDDSLVNVFNAAGYYANSNIVLQKDLYGPDENPSAPSEQVLTLATNVNKTTIYGNGYQVNIAAYNKGLPNKNESIAIGFSNLYNVKLLGDNPNDTLNQQTQKVYFHVNYAYYCDLQYYWKLAPIGDSADPHNLYVKNTVFSRVPKTAIQIYYSQSLYAENITIVECGAGISVEFGSEDATSMKKDAHIYFKGDIDILDYNNKTGLNNMTNGMMGMAFSSVVPNIKDFLEWHGKTVSEASMSGTDIDKFYVNVLIYSTYSLVGKVASWNDEEGYKPKEADAVQMAGNRNIVNKTLMGSYFAWTYDYLNTIEGGNVTITGSNSNATISANRNSMGNIFIDQRYIRLLCEYKSYDKKNEAHILWHKQQVYRDMSLVVKSESNPNGILEKHIDDLKESLKGVKWPDGSGVNANGEAVENLAAALTSMISQTVLPSKFIFE